MGLGTRRPQLPALNLPTQYSPPQRPTQTGNSQGDSTFSGCQPLPISSAPATPLPIAGSPIVFDEKSQQSEALPVTPGFANGPSPFAFGFSTANKPSGEESINGLASPSLLKPTLSRRPSGPWTKAGLSDSSHQSSTSGKYGPLRTPNDIEAAPVFPLSGGGGGQGRRSHRVDREVSWDEREIAIIESFLLNPLQPLSISFPPGTLPPSEALDELTSQILHFHGPSTTATSIRPTNASIIGIPASHSSPSLKDAQAPPVAPPSSKHRRTHSTSGIPWRHGWAETRLKVFEIARKEALGDSREDRFKGRADVQGRALFTAQSDEPAPFSPMPQPIAKDPLDSVRSTSAAKHESNGTHLHPASCLVLPLKEATLESSTSRGTQLEKGLDNAITAIPRKKPRTDAGSPVSPYRPTSLLSRGRSFTADDIEAADSMHVDAPGDSEDGQAMPDFPIR